jgi:hypothetical protein
MRHDVSPALTDASMQTTYREIAADIESRPDALPFDELEQLVDAHLEAKSRQ